MTEPKDEDLRTWSRDQFTGNECDTDEYRETQPMKGLAFIGDYAVLLCDPCPELDTLAKLTETWLHAYNNPKPGEWDAYAGTEELKPILDLLHDALWAVGRHPYEYEGWKVQLIEDYTESLNL